MEVPARARVCCIDEISLVPGSFYVSQLQWDNDVCCRKDYCKKCWEQVEVKRGTFWHARIALKPPPKPDRAVWTLFERLYVSERKDLIYFLALYLERKKQLTCRVKKEPLVYEEPYSGKLFSIFPVALNEEDRKALRAELIKLFAQT